MHSELLQLKLMVMQYRDGVAGLPFKPIGRTTVSTGCAQTFSRWIMCACGLAGSYGLHAMRKVLGKYLRFLYGLL